MSKYHRKIRGSETTGICSSGKYDEILSLCVAVHIHILQVLLLILLQNVPITVTARPKTWVCGRAATGIAVSNPVGCMNVSCECCVFCRERSLRWVDPSSRDSYWVWRV